MKSNLKLFRKMLLCAITGFSSGLPLFFFLNLLPVWLRSDLFFTDANSLLTTIMHPNLEMMQWELIKSYFQFYASSPYIIAKPIDIKSIGLFNLLQLPYTLKFLWAPILDRYSPLAIGRRRGWMLLCQILLLLVMMGYALINNPSMQMWYVIALSVLLTFFSATQDIAIDAYRREILADEELGLGNSITVTTYRLAILVPGSLSLILSDMMAWSSVFWLTALFMLPGMVMVLMAHEPSSTIAQSKKLKDMILKPLLEYWHRKGPKNFVFVISFFILYKLGDSLAISLSSVFYYDIGYSRTMIGSIAQYAQISASIVGGIIGGLLMLKIGINKALWAFGVVQMTSILGYVWLASFGKFDLITGVEQIYLALVVVYEYLGVGFGTAAFVAFMARESNPNYAATQIALLSGISAIPRSFLSGLSGYLVENLGYYAFYWICFLLALPGMIILIKVAPWAENKLNLSRWGEKDLA